MKWSVNPGIVTHRLRTTASASYNTVMVRSVKQQTFRLERETRRGLSTMETQTEQGPAGQQGTGARHTHTLTSRSSSFYTK